MSVIDFRNQRSWSPDKDPLKDQCVVSNSQNSHIIYWSLRKLHLFTNFPYLIRFTFDFMAKFCFVTHLQSMAKKGTTTRRRNVIKSSGKNSLNKTKFNDDLEVHLPRDWFCLHSMKNGARDDDLLKLVAKIPLDRIDDALTPARTEPRKVNANCTPPSSIGF